LSPSPSAKMDGKPAAPTLLAASPVTRPAPSCHRCAVGPRVLLGVGCLVLSHLPTTAPFGLCCVIPPPCQLAGVVWSVACEEGALARVGRRLRSRQQRGGRCLCGGRWALSSLLATCCHGIVERRGAHRLPLCTTMLGPSTCEQTISLSTYCIPPVSLLSAHPAS
jgi:hypothetical protein